jgi:hypothetical protein
MSSSRSIAAARNRRAGEAQPTSQSRPGTSINSQPAFQQRPRQAPQQQQQQQQQQQPRYQQQQQQQQQQQAPPQKNLKLSVSDAIGLITLRLGRVEQILIDQQIEAETNGSGSGSSSGFKIPEGTQLFDKSVMNSIINRLDALEKRDKEKSFSQDIESIKNDFASKLIVFHEKVDSHVAETERRFVDIENAFVELEQQVLPPVEQVVEEHENIVLEQEKEPEDDVELPASVFSLDLKNIVNQELKKI